MSRSGQLSRATAAWLLVASCASLIVGVTVGCKQNPPEQRSERVSPPGRADPLVQHVILISVDTLRADHLACYGHPFVKTPNIDRLASEGMLFEQHISAAPTTLNSHTSIMTGTYPHTHGVPRNEFQVHDDNVMLAEVLKEAGFTTAAFIGAMPLHSQFNFAQGFDHYDEQFDDSSESGAVDQAQRPAERVNQAVSAWLAGVQFERLFLFVHYFDVHWPYRSPEPYARMYRDDTRPMTGSLREIQRVRQGLRRDPDTVAEECRILDAMYCGEITYTDHHIGSLMEVLRRRGLYDHALIVLTSDHGEAMNEHWEHWNHGFSTYETTIRTPLIVRQPGGRLAGIRCRELISNIDVMPTILERLGLSLPNRVEGKSFAALLDGGRIGARGPVFAEATKPEYVPMGREPRWANEELCRAIRTQEWKFVRRPAENICELYDLEADPDEQTNLLLSRSEDSRILAADLAAQLAAWDQAADPLPFRWEIPAHVRELMDSLGYILEDKEPEAPQATSQPASETCP
ncbi:MAG: sulfatase [Phycisphaerales bacterium]|nr:MAG: sulfatase [Phycisphaerales bacterium]